MRTEGKGRLKGVVEVGDYEEEDEKREEVRRGLRETEGEDRVANSPTRKESNRQRRLKERAEVQE